MLRGAAQFEPRKAWRTGHAQRARWRYRDSNVGPPRETEWERADRRQGPSKGSFEGPCPLWDSARIPLQRRAGRSGAGHVRPKERAVWLSTVGTMLPLQSMAKLDTVAATESGFIVSLTLEVLPCE